MLPKSVFKSPFCSPHIEKSTRAFKAIYQKGGVAVSKVIYFICLIGKDIHKSVPFRNIAALATIATGKLSTGL